MSKLKNRRKPVSRVKKGTLDQKHTEKLQHFKKQNQALPAKRKRLSRLEAELAELKSMPASSYRDTDIRRKSDIMDSIDQLKREISSIENCNDSLNYIVKTRSILIDYYDNDEVIDDGVEEELIDDANTTGRKNILTYFIRENNRQAEKDAATAATSSPKNTSSQTQTTTPSSGSKRPSTTTKTTRVTKSPAGPTTKTTKTTKTTTKSPTKTTTKAPGKRVSKAALYDSYLNVTDINHRKTVTKSMICPVPDCGGEKVLSQNDSCMVCKKCGLAETILLTTDKPNYNEPVQDSGTYAYKRINHLTEILSQLQAKESTDIPPHVYAAIYKELKKCKIDKNYLDIFRLRRILKKLGYRNYYDHVPHILQIINGKEPPNFSRQIEAKIKKMFKDIQKPFEIYCPKTRKNFLNYSYVLHKFCELLGLDEYVEYFPLLKNNSKLLQHDRIWMNICKYMKWQYIKSI